LTRALEFDPVARRAFLRTVEVSEIMSRDVIAVGPDATLCEAAALMLKHKIGCLPVVEEGEVLVGLLTETDLLQAAFLVEDAPFPVEVEAPPRGVRGAVGTLFREIRDSFRSTGEAF
jgi:CBS domain-containing protein